MALFDHHDIVLGTSDDGHPFLTVNTATPHAHRLLIDRGFAPYAHRGRTLYFPRLDVPFAEAHRLTEQAAEEVCLVGSTPLSSIADLRWTTYAVAPGSVLEPAVRLYAEHLPVTVTVHDRAPAIRRALADAEFQPTPWGYVLPADMDEEDQAQACQQLHGDLWGLDLPSETRLGVPSPASLPQLPYSGVSRTHPWTAAHIEGDRPAEALRAVLDHVTTHAIEPGAEGLCRLEERIDLLSQLVYRFASRAVHQAQPGSGQSPLTSEKSVTDLSIAAGSLATALSDYASALPALAALSAQPQPTAATAALHKDLDRTLRQAHRHLEGALHALTPPTSAQTTAPPPRKPDGPTHRRTR
ncbi:hypothetical protein [Streptomyces sp. WZ-12]|uniref:hypothetical protein n=1 Tax=Streptomyces sp. WZ-12 TaxID=3030210 RepID=UPI002380EC8E|nr:hypothetical protein [Streptomyces sp. WZ-12]